MTLGFILFLAAVIYYGVINKEAEPKKYHREDFYDDGHIIP